MLLSWVPESGLYTVLSSMIGCRLGREKGTTGNVEKKFLSQARRERSPDPA